MDSEIFLNHSFIFSYCFLLIRVIVDLEFLHGTLDVKKENPEAMCSHTFTHGQFSLYTSLAESVPVFPVLCYLAC